MLSKEIGGEGEALCHATAEGRDGGRGGPRKQASQLKPIWNIKHMAGHEGEGSGPGTMTSAVSPKLTQGPHGPGGTLWGEGGTTGSPRPSGRAAAGGGALARRCSPRQRSSSLSFFSSCSTACFRCRRACLLRFPSRHRRRAASAICSCRASSRSRLLRGSWGGGQAGGSVALGTQRTALTDPKPGRWRPTEQGPAGASVGLLPPDPKGRAGEPRGNLLPIPAWGRDPRA